MNISGRLSAVLSGVTGIMTEAHWTWVLFGFEIVGISGMFVVGLQKWWGWAIVMGHSIPWLIYSVSFERWGFVAMTFLWWSVNGTNLIRWRRAQKP